MSSNRRIRKRSQLQEKRAAQDVGGRTVAGSGAAKHSGGGDVRKQGDLRVECKFTHKDHYTIKLSELGKIQMQAIKGGLEAPVMLIEFVTAPTLKIAIYPDQTHYPVWKSTRGKSFRINKTAALRALLETPKFQLKFVPLKGREQTFTITHWTSYLESLEEENDARDSDD